MRGVLGLAGLLVAVVLVGLLVKRQLATSVPVAAPVDTGQPAAVPLQQLPRQMRQAVDAAMQQPRPLPDDK